MWYTCLRGVSINLLFIVTVSLPFTPLQSNTPASVWFVQMCSMEVLEYDYLLVCSIHFPYPHQLSVCLCFKNLIPQFD